jgi:hypothetical protein
MTEKWVCPKCTLKNTSNKCEACGYNNYTQTSTNMQRFKSKKLVKKSLKKSKKLVKKSLKKSKKLVKKSLKISKKSVKKSSK